MAIEAGASGRRASRLGWALAALLAVAALAAYGGYRYWTGTPQYSLWQAVQAANDHDLATFEKYVDIDGCAGSLIDDVMAGWSGEQPDTSGSTWAKIGRQFAQGLVAYLKPILVAAFKRQVCDYVEKGDAEREQDAARGGISVEKLRQSAKAHDVHYEGLEYVRRDGGIALVGLRFSSQKSAVKSFVVELKMRQLDGYWQVSKWNNAYDILKQFGLASRKADAVQAPESAIGHAS